MFFRHLHHHEDASAATAMSTVRSAAGAVAGAAAWAGARAACSIRGELRLVILALIAEKPRHGYEVIKALGERVGGDYSPSPGVVYPDAGAARRHRAGQRQRRRGRPQALRDHRRGPEAPRREPRSGRRHLSAAAGRQRGRLGERRLRVARHAEPARDGEAEAQGPAGDARSKSRRSPTRSTRPPRRSSGSEPLRRGRGSGRRGLTPPPCHPTSPFRRPARHGASASAPSGAAPNRSRPCLEICRPTCGDLEAEAIHIMREVVAEFRAPVMLYSIGKDSSAICMSR